MLNNNFFYFQLRIIICQSSRNFYIRTLMVMDKWMIDNSTVVIQLDNQVHENSPVFRVCMKKPVIHVDIFRYFCLATRFSQCSKGICVTYIQNLDAVRTVYSFYYWHLAKYTETDIDVFFYFFRLLKKFSYFFLLMV